MLTIHYIEFLNDRSAPEQSHEKFEELDQFLASITTTPDACAISLGDYCYQVILANNPVIPAPGDLDDEFTRTVDFNLHHLEADGIIKINKTITK